MPTRLSRSRTVDKTTTFVAVVLVTILLSCPAVAAPASRWEDTIKVYRDESRTLQLGIPAWKSLGPSRGYYQTRAMDVIQYENLRPYDVMIVSNRAEKLTYSRQELDAIERFVEEGGGVLVVGTPSGHTKRRAKWNQRRQQYDDLRPLPSESFATNQIAALFDVAFSNAWLRSEASFNTSSPLNKGVNLKRLGFEQSMGLLLCTNPKANLLIQSKSRFPVAVAVTKGKGRVIFCAVGRLFMSKGSLVERKLGQTENVIETQRDLLDHWLRWLAEGRNSRGHNKAEYQSDILPGVQMPSGNAVFYCIPHLSDVTRRLQSDWEKVWADLSAYLGVSSPVEFVAAARPDEKLHILVRASQAGGLSGGVNISIPGLAPKERLIGILAHEAGHKLLGGTNTSTSEAFAVWLGSRAKWVVGETPTPHAGLQSHLAAFRKADPTGRRLDITDRMSDMKKSRACQGKWIHILIELEEKYGDDFLRRYVACLRKGETLHGAHRKLVGGKPVQLTMEDVAKYMSEAAGEDLRPWFREMGITVSQPKGAAELVGKKSEPAPEAPPGPSPPTPEQRPTEEGFVNLFDGRTLSGWHAVGKGTWTVEEGAIMGRRSSSEGPGPGVLVSDAVFRDFEVRARVKIFSGDTGLFFRAEEGGPFGLNGLQLDLVPPINVGGLVETKGTERGRKIIKSIRRQRKSYYKPDDWNDLEILARGGDITLMVNGFKTVELFDDPSRREGRFGLQLYGAGVDHVMFKDIRIKELK